MDPAIARNNRPKNRTIEYFQNDQLQRPKPVCSCPPAAFIQISPSLCWGSNKLEPWKNQARHKARAAHLPLLC